MPPMKAAAKKAPGKPSAPKKPTSRSKTGNSACSQAASNWQLAIRGKAPLDPDTYKTLGKCRAMSRAAKSADGRAAAGYNLSEQGRDAIKGRLQKRFDQGLITQKSRQDRLKTLLAQRKEKQAAAATAKTGGDSNKKSLEVPQKNRLKNEITGPSGAKITGYNWSSHLEERYSQREDGLVLKRVSNWDGATKSEGTGRSIVHSFYVTRPDGRVTVEGIGSAQKILGISETRLKTIAKNEADAQRYRQQQDISEVKEREAIAQPSYGEANRDLRTRLGNAPGAEQFYNNSTTYRKDGKFLRVKNTLSDAMRERGWQPYNRSERSSKAAQLLAQRKEKQATAPAPAPAAKQYSPVSRPSVDHSFLSPSGRVSKRSKERAIKKTSETLFGPGGMPHPQLPKPPTEQEYLRRQAAELRDMASRGLKPRAYKKKADELEAKANSLDLPPAPAPVKFSRGGQLAPGRGTAERASLAKAKAESRRLINETTIRVSSSSFNYQSYHPEKRAKGYSDGYTREIRSNMRKQVKRAKTANDAEVINDVLRQHAAGMKSRVSTWANAESRTASWAVTGRGNFNASRNSKRIDSAMNKQLEITDYANGLENAVSRALLKKSDTGNTITRLARIRKRLERRKSELNRGKQGLVRDRVYALRGVDKFYNASKEVRVEALKSSTSQLERIDKDRKTVLGRLKKISSAESKLKQQTRIPRAL